MPIKATTWNIKHAGRLANDDANSLDRRGRVERIIREIDPDILCIQEGPKGEAGAAEFADVVLGDDWLPILLRRPGDDLGDRGDDYQTA